MEFSSHEARKLIEAAVTNPTVDITRLALHAVRDANLSISPVLLSSLKQTGFGASEMAQVLRLFGEYEGLDFVLAALDDDDLMIRAAAVNTLLAFNDKRSLEPLQQMLDNPKHKDLQIRVSQAVTVIRASRRPQVQYKKLESLSEEDYALAEAVLGCKILSDDVSIVRKLGHHAPLVRQHAVKTLMARGEAIADDFYSALRKQKIRISPELINFIGQLKHPDGSDYVISLLKTLHNDDYGNFWSDSEIRRTGITALTNIADSQAINYLVRQLTSGGYDTEAALKSIGAPAVPYLLRAYREDDRFRRSEGATLARILGSEALPALLEGLQDRFREVREEAQRALAELRSIAVEPLITLLDHPDRIVRLHACRALRKIGDTRSMDALLRLSRSNNLDERWEAIEALGSIRDSRTVDELSPWLDSPNRETRRRVAKALGQQVDEKAASLLIKASTDKDPGVRLRAIESIGEHLYNRPERPKLVAILVLAMEDADPEISTHAKTNLVWLGTNYPVIQQSLDNLVTNPGVQGSPTISDIVREIKRNVYRREVACEAEYIERPPPPLVSKIPQPITDKIHFSVTAPRVIGIGDRFILDVWAHFGYLTSDVLSKAKQALAGRDVRMRSRGPVPIERETTLSVLLSIPTFGINDIEETIYWAGETGNCAFGVTVPPNVQKGFHLGVAKFFVAELQVSKLSFEIEVGLKTVAPNDVTTREDRIKTAFASYASEERNKVTGRIQGMLKIMPELDIFLDVMSLRSGDNWARKIEDEIIARDVFYLFWSRAASNSEWVDLEWRTALTKKGLDFIDPVPLEPPNEVPPPPELSSLHFNEWTLAFEK